MITFSTNNIPYYSKNVQSVSQLPPLTKRFLFKLIHALVLYYKTFVEYRYYFEKYILGILKGKDFKRF